MGKRETADSGLIAGFVREQDAKLNLEAEPKAQVEEKSTPKEPASPKKATPKKKVKGPTVSMQGVSGKVIQSVVKVVRKVKPKKKEEATKVEKPVEGKETQVKKEVLAPVEVAPKAEPTSVEEVKTATLEKPADLAQVVSEKTKEKEVPAKEPVAPKAEAKVEKPTEPSQVQSTKETSKDQLVAKASSEKKEAKKTKEVQPSPEPKKPAEAKVEPKKAKVLDLRKDSEAEYEIVTAIVTVKDSEGNLKKVKKRIKRPIERKSDERRTIVDRGVESTAQKTSRIRPQRGNYVGRNSETPKFERRQRYSPGHRTSGAPSSYGRRGPSPFNKDEDETPRQSRSPRPRKTTSSDNVALTEMKRTEAGKKSFSNRSKDRRHYERRRNQPSEHDLRSVAEYGRKRRQAEQAKPKAVLSHVKLPESLTVKELAEALKKTVAEIIMKLMSYGTMATANEEVGYETAEVIAGEFGITAEKLVEIKAEDILFDDSEEEDESKMQDRPPVVVVMGHVDHGKTSILDYIRSSTVADGEAGGITQHIGAYTVDVHGRAITFLDTPGHEAFTTMRARGAQVTDIAILVVAADDGVMPQTIEAINHARAANTEIIVAINKIDKHGINLDRIRQELANHNLMSSDWGGDTTIVNVSALTGENMDELLEMILLTADVLELKANPERQAKGTVIESKLDKGRGPVATVLVQRGTLRQGDTIVVGATAGRIRAMTNDKGKFIEEAGPSVPVEILGLPETPEGGEIFYVVEDEKVARGLVEKRKVEEREQQLRKSSRMSLDNLFAKMSQGEVKDLNLIVKADVQGSVEAVTQSLEKLSNEEVKVHVIHGAVGAVTESDVRLAEVSDAIIIGFNVRPAANVYDFAKENEVDIRLYRVIYNAIEDMEKAMKGLLAPSFVENILGHAEVRETFKVSGIGTIAGCMVTNGKIVRSAKVRVVRNGVVIHEGELASLKRFKDDAREVAQGYECGMSIVRFNDIKLGDQFEAYEMKEVER